jgi:hypothetical protein
MRLNCPACGAAISLDALLGHEGAREAVQIALQLPAPLGKLLVQYVGMFRPAKRQSLSLDRVASLLGELLIMIDAGKIEREGRTYAAPQDYFRTALEDMLARRDSLTLPLKSHGYLLSIIAGFADKAEAKQEAKAEEAKRHRPVEVVPGKTPRKPAPVKLGDVLKNLNRKGSSDGNPT